MIVLKDKQSNLVLNRGVLQEQTIVPLPKVGGMRKVMEVFGDGYE